jgi:alpha 1,3-glucosidase
MWIDYFSKDAREFWADLYSYNFFRGTNSNYGVWIDMNEPSVFDGPEGTLPKNTLHSIDGVDVYHRDVHNAYGLMMAKATY